MNGNQNPGSNKPPSPVVRGSTPKKFKLVMGLFLVFVLAISALVIARAYDKWRGMEEVEKIANALRQYEQEILEKRMADTYGGKTPQETLQLYIDAVEKGDYELASKYFVEEKREKWARELVSIKEAGKISLFLNPLKEALLIDGEYSMGGGIYSIHDPVRVGFMKYPNGVWKISEI